jgi:hypothetical protein
MEAAVQWRANGPKLRRHGEFSRHRDGIPNTFGCVLSAGARVLTELLY